MWKVHELMEMALCVTKFETTRSQDRNVRQSLRRSVVNIHTRLICNHVMSWIACVTCVVDSALRSTTTTCCCVIGNWSDASAACEEF